MKVNFGAANNLCVCVCVCVVCLGRLGGGLGLRVKG